MRSSVSHSIVWSFAFIGIGRLSLDEVKALSRLFSEMIIEMSDARPKSPEARTDSAWSKDAFDVRSEPSVNGGRMPRGRRTTPPGAHGELHSSCEITPRITVPEKIPSGKRLV